MTKRDRQLQEYVAEKRVYGAEGDGARLTDAEREAVNEAAGFYGGIANDARCQEIAATLRALLERTQ